LLLFFGRNVKSKEVVSELKIRIEKYPSEKLTICFVDVGMSNQKTLFALFGCLLCFL